MAEEKPSCDVIVAELRHVTEDLKGVWDELKELRQKLEETKSAAVLLYVSKEQFAPVKNIVYGLVAIIMTSVIGSILLLIIGGKR